MLEEPIVLVLIGAAIALVSSVIVTWLQGSLMRRANARHLARDAIHELWRLFVAERDSGERADEGARPASLTEAEMLIATLADRRLRDRLTALIKLLRECHLPELEQLSGIRASQAHALLCDHALEVLGTQLRGERIPPLPDRVTQLQNVEGEALHIHAGGATTANPASSTSATAQVAEGTVARPKTRRRPRTAKSGGQDSAESDESTS